MHPHLLLSPDRILSRERMCDRLKGPPLPTSYRLVEYIAKVFESTQSAQKRDLIGVFLSFEAERLLRHMPLSVVHTFSGANAFLLQYRLNMLPQIDLYAIILLLGAAHGLFLALILLNAKDGEAMGHRQLALLTLVRLLCRLQAPCRTDSLAISKP